MSLQVSVNVSLVMSCAVWSVSGNYKRFFKVTAEEFHYFVCRCTYIIDHR